MPDRKKRSPKRISPPAPMAARRKRNRQRFFAMAIQNYECLFLLDTTKTSGNVDGAKAQLHATLEKYGAEILASRPWDDRRLAYPIKGQKKGLYFLIFFKADSLKITEMEHD